MVGVGVNLDVTAGLDLSSLFDDQAASRIPDPFLRINDMTLSGYFGVQEYSTSSQVGGFDIGITEAGILVTISANVPSTVINNIGDFNANIAVEAELNVRLPIFAAVGGFGFGALIECFDPDLLDGTACTPQITPDISIENDLIRKVAEQLR